MNEHEEYALLNDGRIVGIATMLEDFAGLKIITEDNEIIYMMDVEEMSDDYEYLLAMRGD